MNLEICFLKVPDKVKTILMRGYMPTYRMFTELRHV